MPSPWVLNSIVIAALLALLLTESAHAQSPIEPAGVLWRARAGASVPVSTIVERVAPILWFSRDEPLRLAGVHVPERLPCDPESTDEPVVYYVVEQDDHLLASTDAITLSPGSDVSVRFLFYYSQDTGVGCHSNDLEKATFVLRTRRVTNSGSTLQEAELYLRLVIGGAHGSRFYANYLLLDGVLPPLDLSLPLALLVEEGKHAIAPDRNGDGRYTPGYDTNMINNDSWGVRDTLGSGSFLGRPGYQASMTKPRWPHDRLRPKVKEVSMWEASYRAPFPLPSAVYSLRPFPEVCLRRQPASLPSPRPLPGCSARTIESFFSDPALVADDNPQHWLPDILGRVRLTAENYSFGVITDVPLVEPFVGGVVGPYTHGRFIERGPITGDYFVGGGLDVGVFYSPSISRYVDWYVRIGWGYGSIVSVYDDGERQKLPKGLVREAGLQWRTPRLMVGAGFVWRSRGYRELRFEIGLSPIRVFR